MKQLLIFSILGVRINSLNFHFYNHKFNRSILKIAIIDDPDRLQILIDLLPSNMSVIDCLTNCTSNGLCAKDLSQNKLFCQCFPDFEGTTCHNDKRPCSKHPCLNQNQCNQRKSESPEGVVSYNYTCNCSEFYTGNHCEVEIDQCQNRTCSAKGICTWQKNTNKTKCNCYSQYEGDNCERQSDSLKTIKAVNRSTGIVAIIAICVFAKIILSMDIFKKLIAKMEPLQRKSEE